MVRTSHPQFCHNKVEHENIMMLGCFFCKEQNKCKINVKICLEILHKKSEDERESSAKAHKGFSAKC